MNQVSFARVKLKKSLLPRLFSETCLSFVVVKNNICTSCLSKMEPVTKRGRERKIHWLSVKIHETCGVSVSRCIKLKYKSSDASNVHQINKGPQWVKRNVIQLVLLNRKFWSAIARVTSHSFPAFFQVEFFCGPRCTWTHMHTTYGFNHKRRSSTFTVEMATAIPEFDEVSN